MMEEPTNTFTTLWAFSLSKAGVVSLALRLLMEALRAMSKPQIPSKIRIVD